MVGFFILKIMGNLTEIWKPIKGFEGVYEISNLGRVKSFKRNKCIILKNRDVNGYHRVALFKNECRKEHKVHRLVCEAFIPNPKNKPFVNHKNSVRNDNNLNNLEWCTASENSQHALKNGRLNLYYGESNGNSKLKENEVISILKLAKTGEGVRSIAKKFNICHDTVYHIVKKKTWNHLKI